MYNKYMASSSAARYLTKYNIDPIIIDVSLKVMGGASVSSSHKFIKKHSKVPGVYFMLVEATPHIGIKTGKGKVVPVSISKRHIEPQLTVNAKNYRQEIYLGYKVMLHPRLIKIAKSVRDKGRTEPFLVRVLLVKGRGVIAYS